MDKVAWENQRFHSVKGKLKKAYVPPFIIFPVRCPMKNPSLVKTFPSDWDLSLRFAQRDQIFDLRFHITHFPKIILNGCDNSFKKIGTCI